MATEAEIASNALLLIGDNRIAALSENEAAEDLFPTAYEALLTRHPWSFAMKEVFLSRLTQKPDRETGFGFAYQRPADMIRLWAILPANDHRVVGEFIYSNSNKVFARYTYKPPTSSLPAYFVNCFQYRLAADFAVSVAEDEQKMQIFERKFMDELASAMAVDSQQHPYPGIRGNPIRRGRRVR